MVSLLIATSICKPNRRSVLWHVLSLATVALVASFAVAQDAGASRNRKPSGTSGRQEALPSNDLPDAAEILDGYVEATGGKKTYEKLKTRIARGTLEIAALGTQGKVQTWQQSPDKLYSI